jgi:flavin reductase (DIM6/NTAB) family NADH-FMN oxidoreductase RutF
MYMIRLTVLVLSILFTVSCSNAPKESAGKAVVSDSISYAGVSEKSFDELFSAVGVEELSENVFSLFTHSNAVITAGNIVSYNSMVASDGGWGILMNKPVTFCELRGIRYTLEVILRDSIYTMSWFDERYREEFMKFGRVSGRSSNKMSETTLTAVPTPLGSMTFKEARLVISCRLAQTHTVNPDELYAAENKEFFVNAQKEVGVWHKIVFGDIVGAWVRK